MKRIDPYAQAAVERLMEERTTAQQIYTLEDVADLAGAHIMASRSAAQALLSKAHDTIGTLGRRDDGDVGLAKGDRTRIKEAKSTMVKVRQDLDRMVYWDSVLATAEAMLAHEKVYQEG